MWVSIEIFLVTRDRLNDEGLHFRRPRRSTVFLEGQDAVHSLDGVSSKYSDLSCSPYVDQIYDLPRDLLFATFIF